MNAESLKSCPFCGGKVSLKTFDPNSRNFPYIHCTKCFVNVERNNVHELVTSWNTRSNEISRGE